MTNYELFKSLHRQTHPVIIGNSWNVQSARIFERLGFQAIGTSSAAIAHSLGYEDNQQMPFEDLLFVVRRIKENTVLPLTVDMESGYGNSASQIIDNLRELVGLGVVGVNLEDSRIEHGTRKLSDLQEFAALIREIISGLKARRLSIFINLRCDPFLLKLPDATEKARERVGVYEKAGVDGLFLPCITREEDIQSLVSHTALPVNVMCMPGLPGFDSLQRLGVKRISMGDFVFDKTYADMSKTAETIMSHQSFSSIF